EVRGVVREDDGERVVPQERPSPDASDERHHDGPPPERLDGRKEIHARVREAVEERGDGDRRPPASVEREQPRPAEEPVAELLRQRDAQKEEDRGQRRRRRVERVEEEPSWLDRD